MEDKTTQKNVVENSEIHAGRDVHIGDNIVHTESETSRRLRLFLYLFVPILAIVSSVGYYQYQKLKQPLSLTVRVSDTTPNPNIPFEKAKVIFTYGEKKPEVQIVEKEKEVTFKDIPANYKNTEVEIICEAEGFVTYQRKFNLLENVITIPLCRDNSLATIFGHVKDEKGYALADVQLTVQDITVLSNVSGFYTMPIPFLKQLKKQRIRAFKQGFINWDFETPVFINTPVDIILKK